MKRIYIPQYNKNLIFFHKSGSSLMVGFFKSLLDWKGIKVADGKGEGETIYFVRNPMERLISIYYHHNVIRGIDMDMNDKVEGLNRFLDEYTTKCKTSDNPHYLPQTWGMKISELSEDKVYKIEDIREGWDRLASRYKPSSNISFSTINPFFTAEEYNKDFGCVMDIGVPMSYTDMMLSLTLYGFINSRLDMGHHHNETLQMLTLLRKERRWDIINKLKDITKDEMGILGYNSKML
jgi:hypothetical protein